MPVQDYYNNEGADRIRDINDSLLHREAICLDLIDGVIKPQDSFVDFGCGTGWFLLQVRKRHAELVLKGVEYSQTQLENCPDDSLDLQQGDFQKPLAFEDASLDFAYSGEVLEHLVDPDYFLRELNRVVKPGGHILLSTPNLCAWHSRILMLLGIQPIFYESSSQDARVGFGPMRAIKKDITPVGHLRLFSTTAMRELLELNGFTTVKMHGCRYDYFPGGIGFFDKMVSMSPGLASGLVVLAKKTETV